MARLLIACLFVGVLCLNPGAMTRAADTGTSTVPTLKDTLDKGLKARLPSEFAFVANVVGKVDDGTLPLSLVESTFLWARRKPDHPFQYFQQGLTLRAQKIGVSL
ncbi:MAG TPA: hypothetical protein VG056_10365 [Pirellulales bacterium]|jgi:hypothetical protein|nr:hypothetical protein [Pirellulales bacterium]